MPKNNFKYLNNNSNQNIYENFNLKGLKVKAK